MVKIPSIYHISKTCRAQKLKIVTFNLSLLFSVSNNSISICPSSCAFIWLSSKAKTILPKIMEIDLCDYLLKK